MLVLLRPLHNDSSTSRKHQSRWRYFLHTELLLSVDLGWTFWRLDLQTQKTMDDVRHEYEAQMGIEDAELEPETDDSEEE